MELDEHLGRLGALPLPDLGAIDGAELARRAEATAREGRMIVGSVLVAALVMGFALQPAPRGDGPILPFGPPAALTPLVLLG